MVVAIVIGVVIVLLVVVMKWADKRDRAKGHVNRRMGDIRRTMRQDRLNLRTLRAGGPKAGGRSPHEFRNKSDRYRGR